MKLCAPIVLALAFWTSPGLRADVTIRYQSEFKTSAALGPAMEPFMKAMQAGSATTVLMRGNQAYTKAGNRIQIFDLVKREMTLIDPAHKTFATFPVSQFADKMADAVPQAKPEQIEAAQQAMASIKTNLDSKLTGNSAEIQGVQAEEREVTLTMDIPIPSGMNQPALNMKLVMHIWTPKKEEVLRVPAIRELTAYEAMRKYILLNPAGMLDKLFGKIPGMSSTMGPMFDEINKIPSVTLRMHVELYMPFLAATAKQTADGPMPGPMMEMNQEVAELSSAPVDASLFEIPKDYAAVPADDMLRDMLHPQAK